MGRNVLPIKCMANM